MLLMSDPDAAGGAKAAAHLEPFTARLTPDAKRRLMALSQIKGDPAYELLEEAFWSHWKSLPSSQKEAAEAIIQLVDDARRKNKKG